MDSAVKQRWKDGITGIAQGLVGAYLGAALYVRIKDSAPGPTYLDPSDVFVIAGAALLLFCWWIVPMGACFGVFAKPMIRRWSSREAFFRGLVLGALVGALAGLLVINAPTLVMGGHSMEPGWHSLGPMKYQPWFTVGYCAVWCGLYSWEQARRRV